jgi:hypothetical protein
MVHRSQPRSAEPTPRREEFACRGATLAALKKKGTTVHPRLEEFAFRGAVLAVRGVSP